MTSAAEATTPTSHFPFHSLLFARRPPKLSQADADAYDELVKLVLGLASEYDHIDS